MKPSNLPPQFFLFLLNLYCPDNLSEEIEGDLIENYQLNLNQRGQFYASLMCLWDVIRFFNPTTFKKSKSLKKASIYYTPFNPFIMWKNYIIIARRNLLRQKENSLINLFGLVTGFIAFILIGLFAFDEFQFDKFHVNGARVVRIVSEGAGANSAGSWAGTSPAIGPSLQEEFPEVEDHLRIYHISQKQLFNVDDKTFLETEGFFAEANIFDFFDIPLTSGDPNTALSERDKVVISEGLAKKYFGAEKAIGKVIKIGRTDVVVSGVFEALSSHFHLDFDFLLPFENLLDQVSAERMNSWVWQDFNTYLLLNDTEAISSLETKLPQHLEKHAHPHTLEMGFSYYVNLQPVDKIHLHSSNLINDHAKRGNYGYLVGLLWVGLFILLIAGINFINLSTAKAVKRTKEVGIRKVVGAQKHELITQFIVEAGMTVTISMMLACIAVVFILPYLNEFTGKSIAFNPIYDLRILMVLIGLTLVTILFSGVYPAFVLSGLSSSGKKVQALLKSESKGEIFRKGLVVSQFALSILLIIGVIVVYNQVRYLNHTDLGFNKEQLVHFPLKGSTFNNFNTTKGEFLKIDGLESASICFGIPGDIIAGDQVIVPFPERRTVPSRIFAVDHDYLSTMGFEILAGRGFSEDYSTDKSHAFVINETAVTNLELGNSPEEAIGKDLEWQMWTENDTLKKGKVIGVVKDFHYASLHEKIQTTVMHIEPASCWKMVARISSSDMPKVIGEMKKTWDQFNTGYPLDYQFVDASFGNMYEEERKLSTLLGLFTLLAISIASIGIFGLSAFSVQQRYSEIGIRKVLGASVVDIIRLLSKEYLILILIALAIASPVGWYLMKNWLQDFSYRISLDIWTFLFAGAVTLIIAGLTVSYQNVRAALMDPVNAIRND